MDRSVVKVISQKPEKLYSDEFLEDIVFDARSYTEEYKDAYYSGRQNMGALNNAILQQGFYELMFIVNGKALGAKEYREYIVNKTPGASQ